MKLAFTAIILLAGLWVCNYAMPQQALSSRGARYEVAFPFDSLKRVDNQSFNRSILADKPYILLDFWAGWCGACFREFPYTLAARREIEQRGVRLLFISVDKFFPVFQKAAKRNLIPDELTYWLPNGFHSSFSKALMLEQLPRLVLVDTQGKIIAADLPAPSHSSFPETLERLTPRP